MAGQKLLLTGATGFVGGSILAQLLASSNPAIKSLEISVLVRKQEQADILAAHGVKPILFKDLDDFDHIKQVASQYDMVIHTANGTHVGSAKALVEGLGERKAATSQDVFYIHTSGTSNIANHPITKRFLDPEPRTFSDTGNTAGYLRKREALEAYGQRTTDVTILNTVPKLGVKTYMIMPGTIYGKGLGLFHTASIQVPALINIAIGEGAAPYIGDGNESWDHVHVADMARLFEILVARILAGEEVPEGEKGIFFVSAGNHSWLQLAQAIGKAGFELGALKSADPVSVTLDHAGQNWLGGNSQLAELGFASRAITSADVGRSWGWSPEKTDDDWWASVKTEFEEIWEAKRTSN